MKDLFQRHEIQFISWFSGIFLLSVVFLAAVGLLPSEFQTDGGITFEQRTRNAVREIIEGGNTAIANDPDNGNTGGNNTGNFSNNVSANLPGNPSYIGSNNTSNIQIQPASQITPTVTTSGGDVMYAEEPTRLVMTSIGVDTAIINPNSTSYEVLDTALTKGAVRYPGSGYPGVGNMFVFGHSTGFSVVQNQAYKTFNKLKNAKKGQTVTVYSKSAVYEYVVTNVELVDKSKALVEFDTTKNMITLSTCDSFGRDQDRYVVEAELTSVRRR